MIKQIIAIYTFLSGFLFLGCHPKVTEFDEYTDIVITVHNEKYDFNAKSTFAMPDKIIEIKDSLLEGQQPGFLPDTYASKILARIAFNMSSLGYKRVGIEANPDLILVPASWRSTTLYYDYWFFWLGSNYTYSGFPVIEETKYTTGTLLLIMFDPKETNHKVGPINQWTGAVNGLLVGTYSDARVNKSIDQAFTQSPYLIIN